MGGHEKSKTRAFNCDFLSFIYNTFTVYPYANSQNSRSDPHLNSNLKPRKGQKCKTEAIRLKAQWW